MGIQNLLKFMKPYVEPIHINKYAGKRVGIDAYSWLHKGAYSCSMELCLDSDSEKKFRYIAYFMHRINLLRFHKITPVVVFDGGSIPCKAATEQERHFKRKTNRDLALARLNDGNVAAATELFQRAISVTPVMAHQLIQVLKSENIEFVVAPYEADAQLAYLSSLETEKGGIAAVITEDSDLLVYGCQAVIFKMDRFGKGDEIALDNVFKSVSQKPSFQNFDKEMFIGMCVLSGCDFLPSIPGIGIVKAYSLVVKYRSLDRILSVLKFEKSKQMPEYYFKSFKEAVAVFQHARVYDSETKKLKHMKPLPEKLLDSFDGDIDFLGPAHSSELPPSIATAIAEGKLDPTDMVAFDTCTRPYKPKASPLVSTTASIRHRVLPPSVATGKSLSHKSKLAAKMVIEEQTITKRKHVMELEDAGLYKLVLPLETHINANVVRDIASKTPDNNPFKKRNTDTKSKGLVSDDKSQVSCVSFEESINDGNFLHNDRASEDHMAGQHIDCTSEQVSVVTDCEISLCVNTESQQSVSSKHREKASDKKSRIKKDKLKSIGSISSEKKKSSILNFFSRV